MSLKKIIPIVQKVIFWLAIAIAISILLGNLVFPKYMPSWYDDYLWKLNSFALFALMIVRPLSDLFKSQIWLRRLVPMRKEVGILSAMIVLSFGLSKYIGWDGKLSSIVIFLFDIGLSQSRLFGEILGNSLPFPSS